MKYILVAIGGAAGIFLIVGAVGAALFGIMALSMYLTDSPGNAFILMGIICVGIIGAVGALNGYDENQKPEE